MFNWLGNFFPYSDLHSLNLDWILSKMKETAAQAAQAIADSAKALAQVIEAKTAAQNAQTAAQNAQAAANNAQTAANNAADSAENAIAEAQTAKSAAQTAQSAAQTAQSAAQTAQNTANTAQSAAETANTGVEALNAKFPVQRNDIANKAINASKIDDRAITFSKLIADTSFVYLNASSLSHMRFPKEGNATRAQISDGITRTNNYFLTTSSQIFQVKIDILESGSSSTIFKCESYPAVRISTTDTVVMLPFTIFNNNTNVIYDGFVKIVAGANNQFTCKVIFKTEPPFNDNTEFVIDVYPLSGRLTQTP